MTSHGELTVDGSGNSVSHQLRAAIGVSGETRGSNEVGRSEPRLASSSAHENFGREALPLIRERLTARADFERESARTDRAAVALGE